MTCLPHKVSSRFCSTADLWFLNASLRAVQLGQIKLNLGLVLQSNERIRRTAVSAAAADVRALSAPRTATAPPLDPVSTEAKSSTANRRPSTVGDFRLKQNRSGKAPLLRGSPVRVSEGSQSVEVSRKMKKRPK